MNNKIHFKSKCFQYFMTSADPKRALPPNLLLTPHYRHLSWPQEGTTTPFHGQLHTHPMDCTNTRTKSGANPAPGRWSATTNHTALDTWHENETINSLRHNRRSQAPREPGRVPRSTIRSTQREATTKKSKYAIEREPSCFAHAQLSWFIYTLDEFWRPANWHLMSAKVKDNWSNKHKE